MVAGGLSALTFSITEGTSQAKLLTAGLSVLGLFLTGPVSVSFSGAVVTCQGMLSSTGISLNATLTVLGG